MTMYQVVEINKGKKQTYMMGFETDADLTSWMNGKRLWEDENKYSIVAWKVKPDGYGFIDLERIWKLNENKKWRNAQ